MPIDRLKPAKYNTRKDLKADDPAYEKVKRSLHDFGYDELASRYDGVKGEYDKVAGQIATMISIKTATQQFVSTLHGLPEKVTAFNPEVWGKLLDHATVNTDGTIHFTFRNGIEI